MNWWQTLASVIVAGGGAGLLGSLISGVLQRPKVRADAVSLLTDAALRQVNELQERTAQAEQEATAARNEAAAARRQVHLLTAEIDECMRKLRQWRAAIFAPDATVPGLRAMIGTESGTNGAG